MPTKTESSPAHASLNSLSGLVSAQQQFFQPTPLLRRLLVILNLEKQGTQPQTSLAKNCAMSPAMINQYIEQLSMEGWLHTQPVDGRSLRYLLTETGQQQGMDLLDACSAEVVRFYAAMRDLIQTALMRCEEQGLSSLAIFGASATGELILTATQSMPAVRIVAVVDSDPTKQGELFWGHRVCHPDDLRHISCDAVLLASWGQKKNMNEALRHMNIQHKVVTL